MGDGAATGVMGGMLPGFLQKALSNGGSVSGPAPGGAAPPQPSSTPAPQAANGTRQLQMPGYVGRPLTQFGYMSPDQAAAYDTATGAAVPRKPTNFNPVTGQPLVGAAQPPVDYSRVGGK